MSSTIFSSPTRRDLIANTAAAGAFPKLIYCNRAEKGGHFAAWEQPTIFGQELRAAFRSFR
jgi:hypothetical protein